MKRILMIGTGGTIASGKTAEGLMPELTSEQLLSFVPAVSSLCRAECLQLLSLDSTNLAPTHWLLIAKAIRERYDRYDGFVISHGTDTMAYTAAALSYLIQGARKPIILTGAQKPISFDSTDSKVNLARSFRARAPAKRAQKATRPFPASIIRIWPFCRTAAFYSTSKTPACPSRSSMTRSTSALRF